jgi:hypothetical protein
MDWMEGLGVVGMLGLLLVAMRIRFVLPELPGIWELMAFLLLPYLLYGLMWAYEEMKVLAGTERGR